MHPQQPRQPLQPGEPKESPVLQERSDAGDPFYVEVSTVRSRTSGTVPAPERSALDAQLPPRLRIARLVVSVALVVLTLVATLGSIPMVRSKAAGLSTRFGPAPTLPAGEHLFLPAGQSAWRGRPPGRTCARSTTAGPTQFGGADTSRAAPDTG